MGGIFIGVVVSEADERDTPTDLCSFFSEDVDTFLRGSILYSLGIMTYSEEEGLTF